MTGSRIDRVQTVLVEGGYSALVAGPGSDMAYLIGNFAHASERPQVLIVPARGEPVIVVSGFEARALPELDEVRVAPYGETDDVYALTTSVSSPDLWTDVLISDDARSDVLLRLQAQFAPVRFSPASPTLRSLRMIKDKTEIEALRTAARHADAAFTRFLETPITGVTEMELGLRLRRLMEDEGLTNCAGIVGSGPNGASPHHHSGDRRVQEGDLVVFDFFGTAEGYWADTTRTLSVGEPSSEQRAAYEAVRKANAAGANAVRPGVTAESVDSAARSIIAAAGFGEAFIHRTGHGIGLDEHEEPYIVSGNKLELQPGMTFTIEPGVYLDANFGIRIEDVAVVTDEGVDILNSVPRELRVVA